MWFFWLNFNGRYFLVLTPSPKWIAKKIRPAQFPLQKKIGKRKDGKWRFITQTPVAKSGETPVGSSVLCVAWNGDLCIARLSLARCASLTRPLLSRLLPCSLSLVFAPLRSVGNTCARSLLCAFTTASPPPSSCRYKAFRNCSRFSSLLSAKTSCIINFFVTLQFWYLFRFLAVFFFGLFLQPPCMLEFSSQPFVESESIVYTL